MNGRGESDDVSRCGEEAGVPLDEPPLSVLIEDVGRVLSLQGSLSAGHSDEADGLDRDVQGEVMDGATRVGGETDALTAHVRF